MQENQATSPMEWMMQNHDEEADKKKKYDVVIGGELITHTAMLKSESSPEASLKRGWISAINSARRRADLTVDERNANVRKIAVAAIQRDVFPRQELADELTKMGYEVVFAENVPPAQRRQEEAAPALSTTPSESLATLETDFLPDYKAISRFFPLDEDKPPLSESFVRPIVTNVFDDNDEPTLAGKVIANMYQHLINRPGFQGYKSENIEELVNHSKEMKVAFDKIVEELNTQREAKHEKKFGAHSSHVTGEDDFHFNGDNMASHPFLFYFNKSKSRYKDVQTPEVRAYITLKPQEREQIHRYFVELTTQLYDGGVDFYAKAASLFGVSSRTDNMIFYISGPDLELAEEIIKKFLREKGIGQGHVVAASHSKQEGLSWADEVTPQESAVWKKVAGSTQPASYNILMATMAIPDYLDRIAAAHLKKDDRENARVFANEAARVRQEIQAIA
jgi:hypothetical protein